MRVLSLVLVAVSSAAAAFDLSGTVVDGEKQPVDGAKVWLGHNGSISEAQTDAAGRFVFADLDVGQMDAVAYKAGYGMDGFSRVVIGSFEVALRLKNAGSVLLRVIGGDYAPVEGARIESMVVGDGFFVPVAALAAKGFPVLRSDASGMLTIPDLPNGGHVRFIVSHRDYADTLVSYLPVDGVKQNIVLDAGVKLGGRVKTPGGTGATGAEVVAFQIGSTGRRDFARVLTDSEGFYTMRVPSGEYFVSVIHPEYASPEPGTVVVKPSGEAPVVDMTLLPAYTLEGHVVGPDEKAMPGVLLAYWVGDAQYTEVLTRHDGTFRLLTPPGKGVLRAIPPDGFVTADLPEIPVDTGDKTRGNVGAIRLKLLPEIVGTVRDAEGKPAANAMVVTRNFFPRFWAITDEDGAFRLQLRRVGEGVEVQLRAEHGQRFQRADFTVNNADPKPVEVTLDAFEPDLTSRRPALGENDLETLVGKPAPALDCSGWFNTPPLTLDQLRGKVVVLAFWGGFDRRPENYDQIEELRVVHAMLKDVGDVIVLGVHDSSVDRGDVEAFVKEYGIEFAVGHDAEPFRTFERYRIKNIPQVVLIDKSGVLRYYQVSGRLLELIKSLRRES